MGTRFIHKGGRIIPIHSDHGDQPKSEGEHAAQQTPPNAPAPVAGKEEHNHPAPVAASPTATPVKEKGPGDHLQKAREAKEYNKKHPIAAGIKKLGKKLF